MSDEQPTPQTALDATPTVAEFGALGAEAYHRGRPAYPAEAVRWLLDGSPAIVLELAAATGKLTRELVELGHAVHACEADDALFAVLEREVSDASLKQADPLDVPANANSVDVVVIGQSFGDLDRGRLIDEATRILKPGGRLALIWSVPDTRIPWVRRLGDLLGERDHTVDSFELLAELETFSAPSTRSFKFWQDINADSIVDLVLSRLPIASLPTDARADKVREAVAFYEAYGRGNHGMQVPYLVHCVSLEHLDPEVAETTGHSDDGEADGDVTLIDFK